MRELTEKEIETLVNRTLVLINNKLEEESFVSKNAYDWIIKAIRDCNKMTEAYMLSEIYYWSCSSNYFNVISPLLEAYDLRLKKQ